MLGGLSPTDEKGRVGGGMMEVHWLCRRSGGRGSDAAGYHMRIYPEQNLYLFGKVSRTALSTMLGGPRFVSVSPWCEADEPGVSEGQLALCDLDGGAVFS
jgi:hypothetical protein